MKVKLLFLMFFLATGLVMASCNQRDKYRPEAKVISSLSAKYPKASRVEWEQEKGYQVAEFREKGVECKAWFSNDGKWIMTESDLKYGALPATIRSDVEKGEYCSWKKDDIDKIERAGMPAVYVLEMKKDGQEAELYYSENGELMKVITERQKKQKLAYIPLDQSVRDKITLKYPKAVIIEADEENGMLEVDILDKGINKEVVFSPRNEWISTSWEVRKNDIPAAVSAILDEAPYKDYRIDDAHFVETPGQSYYLLELEKGNSEIKLAVTPEGEIVQK